jgi:hypothetical protein
MKTKSSKSKKHIPQLVERGFAIHQQLIILNEELKKIKEGLKTEAAAYPAEHLPLLEKDSEGSQWIAKGNGCECRIVFPDPKTKTEFDPCTSDFLTIRSFKARSLLDEAISAMQAGFAHEPNTTGSGIAICLDQPSSEIFGHRNVTDFSGFRYQRRYGDNALVELDVLCKQQKEFAHANPAKQSQDKESKKLGAFQGCHGQNRFRFCCCPNFNGRPLNDGFVHPSNRIR